MSRAFNTSQRIALWLAADGKCSNCGSPLETGWHADHIHPFSRGGETDVTNGQALCPTCNLKKGHKVPHHQPHPDRAWQIEARNRLMKTTEDFLVEAFPGTGKTTFAIRAYQELHIGGHNRLIVVVPSLRLKRQWAEAAAKNGVQLNPDFGNNNYLLAADFDGMVVTYQTVVQQPDLYRKLTSEANTVVVFDEIHHAGDADHLQWGQCLMTAFEPAKRRILLSGTPFRTDGEGIPFVFYDESGFAVPGYRYGYSQALRDGVVRNIDFFAQDGEVSWAMAGKVNQTTLALTDETGKALMAALDPRERWVESVIAKADETLTEHREINPRCGGLLLAYDQPHARSCAEIIRKVTGAPPAIAVSDDPAADEVIAGFAESDQRWIVAVKKISEGVDIPRLTVGVYATNVQTRQFFVQAIGRFLRMFDDQDQISAAMFIPSIQPLVEFATEIERIVAKADKERYEEKCRVDLLERTAAETFTVLGASEAKDHLAIRNGDQLTPAEMEQARILKQQVDSKDDVTTIAKILRLVQPAHSPVATTDERPVLVEDQRKHLKAECNGLVNAICRATGSLQKNVNRTANLETCGMASRRDASIEQLERCRDFLLVCYQEGWKL